MRLRSKLLFRIFSKLAGVVKPDFHQKYFPKGYFSPHLEIISNPKERVYSFISKYRKNHSGILYFLDVGGRHGEYHHCAKGFEYHILEINENSKGTGLVYGDICHCPQIMDNT